MSTKSSISSGSNFHLYAELFDKNNIYISIDNVESSVQVYDNGSGRVGSKTQIRVPISIWNEMLKGWKENKKHYFSHANFEADGDAFDTSESEFKRRISNNTLEIDIDPFDISHAAKSIEPQSFSEQLDNEQD